MPVMLVTLLRCCVSRCAVMLVALAVLLRQSLRQLLRQLLRQFSFPLSVLTFPFFVRKKKLALCLHNWQIIAIFVSY